MNNRLRMRLHTFISKSDTKEVNTMVILNGGIAFLMALNFAVNTALGLLMLAHCPHFRWPIRIKLPDFLRNKPDLKAEEKGGTDNEQSVD